MRSAKLLAYFSCILMATAALLGYALLATHRKTSSRGFHAKFLLSISGGNHEEQQWLAEGLEQTLQRHDRSQALDLDPFWGPHIRVISSTGSAAASLLSRWPVLLITSVRATSSASRQVLVSPLGAHEVLAAWLSQQAFWKQFEACRSLS